MTLHHGPPPFSPPHIFWLGHWEGCCFSSSRPKPPPTSLFLFALFCLRKAPMSLLFPLVLNHHISAYAPISRFFPTPFEEPLQFTYLRISNLGSVSHVLSIFGSVLPSPGTLLSGTLLFLVSGFSYSENRQFRVIPHLQIVLDPLPFFPDFLFSCPPYLQSERSFNPWKAPSA